MSHESMSEQPTFFVGVGASAGGLEALCEMFGHAPSDERVCYLVVLHLAPDHRSLIAELLGKQTGLYVERATNGVLLRGNTVYVIEPRTTLICDGRHLRVEEYRMERHLHRPIDILFDSLATSWGHLAAAVVLSGTGSDGSRGSRAIKQAGGLVIAQRPDTAAFDSMPNALIATGLVDITLRPADICSEIGDLVSTGTPGSTPDILTQDTDLLTRILNALRRHTDVDFARYKPSTIARRIERRRGISRAESFIDYAELIEREEPEAKRLCNELLIGVTQFFRDTEFVKEIANSINEAVLTRDNTPMRIWVAGCSTGEEAYTVAMLTSEAFRLHDKPAEFKIFATDVNEVSLATASLGRYSAAAASEIPGPLLSRYFTHETTGEYATLPILRDKMLFSRHDLLKDPPFSNLDLVTCRNVLIYLSAEAQAQLSRVFGFALRRGGLLWLGPSETPSGGDYLFETVSKKGRVFRAMQAGGRSLPVSRNIEQRNRISPSTPPLGPVRSGRYLLDGSFYLSLSDQLLPPYVVFDDNYELRFQSGTAHRFLSFEDGPATLDIRRLIPQRIRLLLSSAVERESSNSDEDIVLRGVEYEHFSSGVSVVDLRFRRLKRDANPETLTVLFFEPTSPSHSTRELAVTYATDTVQERIDSLERELEAARHHLKTTVAKLEASNEELQSTNEELMASNEELMASNEELQSVNEELHTVNAELQSKVEELSRVTADMDEVLATVDTGILVLDGDLKIRRFNERAANFVRVVSHDTGRPLSHLSHSFAGTPILDDCARAMREGTHVERLLFSDDGARVLFRAKPVSQSINSGVLVSFSDVSSLETLEDTAHRLNEAIEQLDSPVVLLDSEGIITYANRCFSELSRRDACFLPGTAFVDLLSAPSRDEFKIALEQVRSNQPWRGMNILEVPGAAPLAEEVRLRPIFSKTGSVIGAARFSSPIPDLGRDVRILLIEDNPADAKLVEECLRADGLLNRFFWLKTAESALEHLMHSPADSLPDLILLDLGLPGMSGQQFLAELKQRSAVSHIPVVILTFSDLGTDIQKASELGAVAFVTKPVGLDGFRKIIHGLDDFWFSVVRHPRPGKSLSVNAQA
jgi:two-component system CheB/CheR fusion protein